MHLYKNEQGYKVPDPLKSICSSNKGLPPMAKRQRYYEAMESMAA